MLMVCMYDLCEQGTSFILYDILCMYVRTVCILLFNVFYTAEPADQPM
jgi:hypothetical protein